MWLQHYDRSNMCDHELKSFVKITINTYSDGHSPRRLPVVDGHTLIDGGFPQDGQIHLSLTTEYAL